MVFVIIIIRIYVNSRQNKGVLIVMDEQKSKQERENKSRRDYIKELESIIEDNNNTINYLEESLFHRNQENVKIVTENIRLKERNKFLEKAVSQLNFSLRNHVEVLHHILDVRILKYE